MAFEREEIGDAVLYRGDCLEVMATLPDGCIDAVVTDPPYGVNLTQRVTKHTQRSASKLYQDDTAHIHTIIIPRVQAAINKAPVALITCGVRWLQSYPPATDIGTVFFPNGVGCSPWGFSGNNPILYYGTCPYLKRGLGSRPNSVSATHWRADNVDHPCPKPEKWMNWMVLRATTEEGQVVLDPFMGSGTTGIACYNLRRKFIGIELEKQFFDLACRRIEEAQKQLHLFQ